MKGKITLLLLAITSLGYSQIPNGYYNNATGTGATLKTQLYNIIKGHTDRGYNGLWATYETSDRDVFNEVGYENDNSIYDIYSENPSGSTNECNFIFGTSQDKGSGGSNECDAYNREHVIPQSIFSGVSPQKNDAHFVPPTDKKVNNVRDSYPHGNVSNATYTSKNGSKLGSSAVPNYNGTVFEPNLAFKGDIARMYFYFATRYENVVASYTYEMFNKTNFPVFQSDFLEMLKNWHKQDPPSVYEIRRNNAIFARQGNRNPYIDHPEYVTAIWGVPLSNEENTLNYETSIYPNPSEGNFTIAFKEIGNYEVEIISIVGQKVADLHIDGNETTVENLPKGAYLVKITRDYQSTTKKLIIN